MSQLEIEYKTLLSTDEYHSLLTDFQDVTPVCQTNYYIDTPNFDVKKARMSLRIRTFEDAAELTLKVPQEVGNLEYNQDLTLEQAQALIKDFVLPRGPIHELVVGALLPLQKLKVLGHLTTLRYEKETPIGLMALDKNSYADKTDYELEMEVTHAQTGKKAFERYLMEKGITFKYASSKVARFAATLTSAK